MENEFRDITTPVDFGNVEEIANDCWLFLTSDKIPAQSMIKKEAFMHEVGAVIESCRKHYAKQLSEAYDEYITLLDAEIQELIGFAHAYGGRDWRSARVKKGKELRQKISELKSTF